MNFADQIAVALSMGRELAEARMRGSCVIERSSGAETDSDGVVSADWSEIYAGKCYTRYPGLAHESTRDVAGSSVVESRLVVRIPFGAVIRPGDRVTITADVDNPQMAGTVLRVASIDDQSQATAQRLLCSDFQGGVA